MLPAAPGPGVSSIALISIGELVCERCHRHADRGSPDVCAWWPKGCRTEFGDPRPRRCWECCDHEQRADLADAGCSLAAARLRGDR